MNNNSQSQILGLSCFPNIENKFITWGTEINLYEFQSRPSTPVVESHFHEDLFNPRGIVANFLTAEDKYQYIRCIRPAFYDNKPVVAVGLSNGKVGICHFENSQENLEFTPKQPRTCLCLAWNDHEKSVLAMGHDRNRSDYCITIWDTKYGLSKEAFVSSIGNSDTAHSICWDKTSRTLISGISQKNIKMFDLRQQTSTASTVISTRLVNGVSISPEGQYLASYMDSIIGLWDMRNIDRPLTQLSTTKPVSFISWCPKKTSVLAAVQRGSPYLQIVDIHSVDVDGGHELYSTKKNFIPSQIRNPSGSGLKANPIADFSWHTVNPERILVLLENGYIQDFYIPQKISIAWDNENNFWQSSKMSAITYDNLVTKFKSDITVSKEDNIDDDIAYLMRKRALVDYGLNADIKKNGDLAHNPTLKIVWNMLDNLYDDGVVGLKNILGIDQIQTMDSEIQTFSWPEYVKNMTSYRSESRTKAQFLCGWKFENDMSVFQNKFLPELVTKKENTRAAMIAVFYLRMTQACDILMKSTNDNDPSILRMAAIALSNYDSDHSSAIWKQQALASSQIRDPYLRTIFSFLTIENDNFESILIEKGISLADRVAFACKYLSDTKLVDFIKQMIQKSVQDGDINGLLLTGESNESTAILQSYVDRTFDIQTVALLVIRFFHIDEISDYRVQYWISSYLDLLDAWSLWEKRAELEIKMSHFRTSTSKTARSVFLLCNFCGKSVSSCLDDVRMRNVSSNVNLSSCPNCRKPLPRCALCLLHMGTPTGILSGNQDNGSLGWQSKPFSKWFSWCQTCRHGGHVEHLMQWFQKNIECPVTGCTCKCFDMDLPVPKFPRDITFN